MTVQRTMYLTLCGLTGELIIPWGRRLSGLVHEKSHPNCLSHFIKSPLEGIDTRCMHHCLIQTIHPTTLCEKKNFLLLLIHPGFSNFNVWPLVPLTFESFVNSSFMSILVNRLYVSKTSIKSCVFLLPSNIHISLYMRETTTVYETA